LNIIQLVSVHRLSDSVLCPVCRLSVGRSVCPSVCLSVGLSVVEHYQLVSVHHL